MEVLRAIDEATDCYTVESCITETTFFLQQAGIDHRFLFNLLRSLPVRVLCLTAPELNRTEELMSKYSDLPMDFADAALVAAAERHDIRTVLTIDRKDFSIYRPRHTKQFKLLPC
jgi:predicted nucleic acid-binding protein